MSMMGAVLGVVGGVMQGIGAMQAHNAQAKADEYNAAVATRNAQVLKEQGAAAVDDQLAANRRQLSSIRGIFLSNGISQTGSMMDVVLDHARAQVLSIQRIRYSTELQVIEQTDKYNLAMMGAADEHAAAGISLVSGILGGFNSAVGSMTRSA